MSEKRDAISYEEQIVKLTKRTCVSIALLRQLPAEKLSDYYNKISTTASKGIAVFGCSVATLWGFITIVETSNGNIGWAIGSAAVCALNGMIAKTLFDGAANNNKLGRKIQAEIASMIPSKERPAPRLGMGGGG